MTQTKSLWDRFPWITALICVAVIGYALKKAYDIRTFALVDYGYVIHEFDPWFNFRATEYLYENGVTKFFQWYDHRSWFPIGRPVGTTIYPGMQLTAVAIKNLFENSGSFGISTDKFWNLTDFSLNDVCCLIPCWFGVLASILTGMMGYETSRSLVIATLSTFLMAIIPAHIMRSVGGGFDNESVAVSAMTLTFYFYLRSIAVDRSWFNTILSGICSGFAYIYMVAAWGGFIFVLNMVAFHAFFLCLKSPNFSLLANQESFSYKLFVAYFLFYVIGTIGAIQVPVVGWSPLKSLEQLFGLVAFVSVSSVAFCQYSRKKHYSKSDKDYKKFIFQFAFFAVCIASLVVLALYPTGYFGPLSARIRALFVPHTRTGNPLTDSVAEHRATSPGAYIKYLHICLILSPIGLGCCFLHSRFTPKHRQDQAMFLILYAFWAYYFSNKMVRLMILLGPIASILSSIALELFLNLSLSELLLPSNDSTSSSKKSDESLSKKKKKQKKTKLKTTNELNDLSSASNVTKKVLATCFLAGFLFFTPSFIGFCEKMAERSSHPSIMFKVKDRLGNEFILDDYRESYFWLRDNTDEDSRIMAWWDYGYQISGIGRRITIADGNTWSHEHIATLGKCLVSSERHGHEMIKHLADYVLLWTGNGGDDLGKSPHIARIANSVYSQVCGHDDPLCKKFSFYDRNREKPMPMMQQSVIFNLISESHNKSLFELVYTSKYGKVKIFKVKDVDMESREFGFNADNYLCDESGWLCRGQYPPKFRPFMEDKQDFAQLENFNVGNKNEEYQKNYHKAFN